MSFKVVIDTKKIQSFVKQVYGKISTLEMKVFLGLPLRKLCTFMNTKI